MSIVETMTFTSAIALGFGILHALEPGHGKTALLTYLASGKKTWVDGLVIALTSAATHTFAVFFIAFASHFLFHHSSMEAKAHFIGEFLSLVSGALIIGLGVWIILKEIGGKKHNSCSTCCDHHHKKSLALNKRRFFASGILGIATGIIPCPTVVVAYLSGVSTGNSYLGIQNVLLFAAGMCLSLMAVVIFFSVGGAHVKEKIKPTKYKLNWSAIQGSIFIVIGFFTALYH